MELAAPAVQPLMLQTAPPRARVRRDGQDLGATPLPLRIPPGEHWTVELSLAGYEARTVTVAAGQPAVTIHLDRAGSGSRPPRIQPIAPIQPRPLAPQPMTRPVRRPDPRAPDLDDPWAHRR